MYKTELEQAIDSQNQLNSTAGTKYNPAHYLKKQKEAQIVRIESSDNSISMNLPAIVPNFQELGDLNGDSSNDLYYEVKSFRCRNKFLNIKSTDRLRFTSFIEFTRLFVLNGGGGTETYDRPGVAAVDFPIVLNEVAPEYVLTADEIAENLSIAMFDTIWKGPVAGNDNLVNLSNLLDYGQFTVKDGKFEFEYNHIINKDKPGEIRENFYVVPLPNGDLASGNDYFCMNSVTINIMTVPGIDEVDAERLSKVFGMEQFNEDTGEYVMTLTLYPNQLESVIMTSSPYIKTVKAEEFGNLLTKELVFESTGGPMYVYPFDKIYIRSNLQSNMWTKTGKKTNVIAVVPMQGSQDSLSVLFESQGSGSRVYNIKDSLNSIQHLQLFFTDEYGLPIQFLETYELELAVFFVPQDALVATV